MAAGATFGAQNLGVQTFGMQGIGVQGFVTPFGGGGVQGGGMAFGVGNSNTDFETRLIQTLGALAAQGKIQGALAGKPLASSQGAGQQGADADDLTRQFVDLERRLGDLSKEVHGMASDSKQVISDVQKLKETVQTNTTFILKQGELIDANKRAILALEKRVDALDKQPKPIPVADSKK